MLTIDYDQKCLSITVITLNNFFCSNLSLSFTFNGDDRKEIVHQNIDSFLLKQFDCVTVFSRNRMKGKKTEIKERNYMSQLTERIGPDGMQFGKKTVHFIYFLFQFSKFREFVLGYHSIRIAFFLTMII